MPLPMTSNPIIRVMMSEHEVILTKLEELDKILKEIVEAKYDLKVAEKYIKRINELA